MNKMCACSLGVQLYSLVVLSTSEKRLKGNHLFICDFLNTDLAWHRCQEILLSSMQVELNIAHNTALRENVFMMAICIELRIPLFIIGKPGSSKSLAKSIVTSSMLGAASSTSLLKKFKEVRSYFRVLKKHKRPFVC